ncbi:MAG: hypothetical protein HY905_22825 [Deltaproteobacteria bacterium]|nr:hypothetical protein [Deltaproteobacteria bacterium]
MGRRHAGFLALLLAGCGPATGSSGVATAGIGPGDWRTDEAPAARAMRDAASALERGQFAPTGAEGRAFVVKGGLVTVAADAPAGHCLFFVSTSSRELADLDAFLFEPSGALVDQDRRNDNHPTIRYCPTQGGTVYLVYEAYDGNGLFYWAVFDGPGDSPLGVSDVFRDVTEGPADGGGAEEMQERARSFAEIVTDRGFAVVAQDEPVHLAAGAEDERAVTLAADRCYTFGAYGGAGATDVDLYLTAPDGGEVALDEDAALDAYVQWCPVVAGEFHLRLKMAGDGGDVLVVRLEASAERIGGLDGLWLGTRNLPGPTHLSLEQTGEELARHLETMGYRMDAAATLTGEARQMVIRTHMLDLGADKCHVFGAVGGPEVADLDLFLYDSDGNEVAADEALTATAVVQVCPQENGRFRLDVAMRRGFGPYEVLRGASPAVGAEAARGLDTVAKTRLRTVVDRIHIPELVALGGPQAGELRERGVRRFENELREGECFLFVAVGAQPVVDIDLYVYDPDGEVAVRDDQPDAMPAVQFCASRSGTWATDVKMIEGSGAFTLLQYRTPAAGAGTPATN